ncbi:MAG: CsbD family protein [Candidatus Acidiferrales bacterium]
MPCTEELGESTRFLREARWRHGNHPDRSSRCVFARRWRLGILPLAPKLASLGRQDAITSERHLISVLEREIPEQPIRGARRSRKSARECKSCQRRYQHEASTKGDIKGKAREVKGIVKEKAGQLTNNSDLEAEGQDEKTGGKVQKKIGQVATVLEK